MDFHPDRFVSLARQFGPRAATRALMLVQGGAVTVGSVVRVGYTVEVEGVIRDGGYPVEVTVRLDETDGEVFGEFCTEHGSDGCEHTIAVLLAGIPAEVAPAPQTPAWQRTLSAVVPATAEPEQGARLALFMGVVVPRRTARDRWSYGVDRESSLAVRPALMGARGRWIKGSTEWHALSMHRAGAHVIGLLEELAGRHDMLSRSYMYGTPEWLPLADVGSRGLWQLLLELREAGVEMISPGKAQHPVRLSEVTARARVVVEEHDAHLHVRAELLIGDELVDPTSVHRVGSPAIAVAQVSNPGLDNEQTTLVRLDSPVAEPLWTLLTADEPVSIGEHDRDAFERDYLPGLRTLAPLESPDHSYEIPAEPQLALELDLRAHRDQVHLTWAWTGTPPGRRRDQVREQEILARVRDAVGEHAHLAEAAPSGTEPRSRTLLGTKGVIFLAEVLPRLREVEGVRVVEGEDLPSYSPTASGPVVSIAAEPGENDWFDLRVKVEVDGEQVPFGDMFVALARGEPIFVLPDGRYFSLTGPEFDRLRAIIEEARALSDKPLAEGLRISRYQVDLWQELVDLGIVHAQEQAWLQAARGLTDSVVLEQLPVPAGVRAELRHYQQTGLSWLHFLRTHALGGILADDMGLGKTLQAIAMMEAARAENPAMAPFVVVAPTSVVGNWVRECRRFAPELRVVAIDATERRRGTPLVEAVAGTHVVVTSYTLLRLEEEAYQALPWSGAIFDEAQMIKNHRARGYRSAKLLPAPFKLAITGTPLENNLTELWALSALVCPGLLGGEKQFADLYRAPIEKDHDTKKLARLQRRLAPFLLRRRKEEVATELPPKQEQVRELELHPKHRRLYELRLQRERQKVLGLIEDMEANRFQVFRSLTLLRQLALDAELVDWDEAPGGDGAAIAEGSPPPSAKLEALTDLLNEAAAEGHRVLVFSQFTRFLSKARDRAEAAGVGTAYLDGRTRHREAEIERFRAGDAPAFFVSLKAGGFGLNLTEADYVVLLDPWWNPAAEAQAIDRTHRIGQTRSVMVYRLVAADTIEAKVLGLSARKAKLFADVLDGGAAGSAGNLTADEIRGLVS